MRRVIVRYRVKRGRGDENAAYVRKVFEELVERAPKDLRYMTFVAEDGVSFTHVASIETDDGTNPLTHTRAFKEFQAELEDRCDEPPQATTVELVGTYRAFN